MNHNLELGQKGEEIAINHLENKGFNILDLNWRHSRTEIDIIASLKSITVFIEVKTRSNTRFGHPEEIISTSKMNRMAEAAEVYMNDKEIEGEIRFDIISIILSVDKQELKHIEDAFFPYE